jgi:hypothetical protein
MHKGGGIGRVESEVARRSRADAWLALELRGSAGSRPGVEPHDDRLRRGAIAEGDVVLGWAG